jgi:hypothetical protein
MAKPPDKIVIANPAIQKTTISSWLGGGTDDPRRSTLLSENDCLRSEEDGCGRGTVAQSRHQFARQRRAKTAEASMMETAHLLANADMLIARR